jgi:hypothetical protein
MQLPIAPPFLDAVLLRVGLFHFIMAWSGIGAALGLMALIVEDALKKRRKRRESVTGADGAAAGGPTLG